MGSLNDFSVNGAVRKNRKTIFSKRLGIGGTSYDGNAHAVTILLSKPFKGAMQVTVHGGLMAANGASSDGDFSTIVG